VLVMPQRMNWRAKKFMHDQASQTQIREEGQGKRLLHSAIQEKIRSPALFQQ
jgi:hypothetical protein